MASYILQQLTSIGGPKSFRLVTDGFAASGPPIGRTSTPNDIPKGIVFLASDDAAFMTGAGLVIDGGITAQYGTKWP